MMHDEADALLVGVAVQCRQVEVGVGGQEVEDEILLLAVPVLPAYVPTLDKEGVESVLGGEVDIAAHIGVVGAMGAVRLGVDKVGLAQLHRGEVVGVAPSALARNHLPPNAHILHWVNPRDILQRTGVIQVEDKARPQCVGGLIAHHHRAPRRVAGGLHTALVARCIGAEPSAEGERFLQIEVHGGIV